MTVDVTVPRSEFWRMSPTLEELEAAERAARELGDLRRARIFRALRSRRLRDSLNSDAEVPREDSGVKTHDVPRVPGT